MSPPEPPDGGDEDAPDAEDAPYRSVGPRYGRYVGLLAIVIIAAITINTLSTRPNGVTGVQPGERAPPFAVPLATGNLPGDANIATGPHQGAAGEVPACSVRGPRVFNICQLYEQGPVVLALFVNAGSCPRILSYMQSLAPAFPSVRFAAVAIRGDRSALRRLLRSRAITLPVGIDSEGVLVALYKDASCPQVSFIYPGGVIQSRAMLHQPSLSGLRGRVAQLLGASRSRESTGAPTATSQP